MKLGNPFNSHDQANGRQDHDAILEENVRRLMEEMRPPADERRENARATYFRPATLMFDCDERPIQVPAYVRDISEVGIGFLHSTPIEPGNLTAKFVLRNEETVIMRVNLRWCIPSSEYWYISGGEFLRDG